MFFFGVMLGMLILYIQKEYHGKIKILLIFLIMIELCARNGMDNGWMEFPVREKDFSKIEKKNNICINVFCYENKLVFPIHISNENFQKLIDLLLVIDGNKSHYVYINDFNRFMFHKTKNKNKKYFCKSCLQCFSSKNVLTEHKEICLSINGAQSVRLEIGAIQLKN